MASGGWWVKPDWTGVPQQSASSPGQGWHGPYPTQDAAFKAELASGPAGTQRIGTVPGAPSYTPPSFSWLGVLGHWVGDFVLHLTDVHMWISLGWIWLGVVLIIAGILFWLKLPQKAAKAAGTAVKASAAI